MSTLELPIGGMDCAACAKKVQRALKKLPGVENVEVLLNAEKAIIDLDPKLVSRDKLKETVLKVGFTVPAPKSADVPYYVKEGNNLQKQLFMALGILFGVILLLVVGGEALGVFAAVTELVPLWVGTLIVLAFGATIFLDVFKSLLRLEITAHTLMTVGATAALVTGQWDTAAVVVFLMRVGVYIERFTSEKARGLLRELQAMAPTKARVERNGDEIEVAVEQVVVGDIVVVRPGERVPVDGIILEGQATLDQAAITGESMPVEAETGDKVFAATIAKLGYVKLRAESVGRDTTFGRTVKLVEEAEANRGEVQRIADKFSGWYLPIVAAIAALTYVISGNVMAVVAVLVVACSCSFALATPIAMMASIGAAAKRGLLIKGGKYIEAIKSADVVLVDKTGTLTTGKPNVTDIVSLDGTTESELLQLAATAERHSEHPLAEAVRAHARDKGLRAGEPERFEAIPGKGIRAVIGGRTIEIGNRRLVPMFDEDSAVARLESEGKTLLIMSIDGRPAGILAAMDTVRPEVGKAIDEIRKLGITRIELLTGDNERTAAAIAGPLGIGFQANLLPEDKIRVVRENQAKGHRVVMVGDGVNDAPALAQAEVGIAMGGGTDVAMEAAHIVLMREDWGLIADVFRIARRTMGVVKMNIAFTALYNLAGLSLAATGVIPPIVAASLQAVPDIGILANSSRLIKQK
ncbi:heavy metal translocating P-type ATPase [Rhizobium metallidurans]|uniref:Cd2+/Zn2+-exporting ATPase/Cu+-exporting ATPase n=1 Tax=Rhizobium metallidurans TaxID=1265931 RepID=A0A7W6GBW2_9HYPH|nr:cation-translocating P-type ATPase [Rhizobium metallidurans]MBB3965410.1 Cd2+/Zn2+-exporting ATPase/Cu+-exporting ATPase [Rhizobium metallidurans]